MLMLGAAVLGLGGLLLSAKATAAPFSVPLGHEYSADSDANLAAAAATGVPSSALIDSLDEYGLGPDLKGRMISAIAMASPGLLMQVADEATSLGYDDLARSLLERAQAAHLHLTSDS